MLFREITNLSYYVHFQVFKQRNEDPKQMKTTGDNFNHKLDLIT